jgi:hypothetical protein
MTGTKERSYGAFARSIKLPDGVDPDAIKANTEKRVLKVTMPKPAPAKAKKVERRRDFHTFFSGHNLRLIQVKAFLVRSSIVFGIQSEGVDQCR